MRTIILGNSGSGKSTLARRLASPTTAILCLDDVAFSNRAERRPLEESVTEAKEFTDSHSNWVVEGCYADIIEHLLPRCDHLIFLNPGVNACIDNCNRRPWEPDKYESKQAQDEFLPQLLDWVRQYETREDEYGLRRHRTVFEEFPGSKEELRELHDA